MTTGHDRQAVGSVTNQERWPTLTYSWTEQVSFQKYVIFL